MGHGEWAPQHDENPGEARDNQAEDWELQWEPEWTQKWLGKVDEDLNRHEKVLRRGYPNRWGAQ